MKRKCLRRECDVVMEIDERKPPSRWRTYCSAFCGVANRPEYLARTKIIEEVRTGLELGLTPQQVYADFCTPELSLAALVRLLERRRETELACTFRRWYNAERKGSNPAQRATA